jgi:hypothetical protein
MSSFKQIEANRRNALKSTGPTTPEGKRRSRCNAVRHGLTAETVIAVLENSDDYEAFEHAVISDYDAESAVERELVLRLASVLWRLRRATSIESGLFESVIEDTHKPERLPPSRENLDELANLAERRRLFLGAANESAAAEANELSSNPKTDFADCFLRLVDPPTFALDRLSRYEHVLWRQARQIVLHWSRCDADDSRAAQPFHFRSRAKWPERFVARVPVTTREPRSCRGQPVEYGRANDDPKAAICQFFCKESWQRPYLLPITQPWATR